MLASNTRITWIAIAFLGVALSAARAGDDEGWSQYYGGPAHDNYRKTKDKIRVPKVLWKLEFSPAPAVVGKDVYAGGKELRRIDLMTGEVRASWAPPKSKKEVNVSGTPVVLKDRVIVNTIQGDVVALDRNLERVLWKKRAGDLGYFSGVCDGTAYVVCAGGAVVAFDVKSGQQRWKVPLGGRAAPQMTPAIADGKVLFGDGSGKFHARSIEDGSEVWSHQGDHAFAWTNPVVAKGRVFCGDRGGNVNAFDLDDGKHLWKWESGAKGLSTPGIAPKHVLVGFSKFIAVIDQKTGKIDPKKQGFRTDYNPFGSPTLVGKTLFFGNIDGHLYAFDYKTERLKWAFEVGEEKQVMDFVYAGGVLVVSTTEGLYAIGNDPKRRKLPRNFVLATKPEEPVARTGNVYKDDVAFALKRLERHCGRFLKLKKIDWKKVSKEFLAEAGRVKSDQDHWVLLARLVARLEDGHAAVRPMAKGRSVRWPSRPERVGPGMFWCRIGGRIYVKNSWAGAEKAGIKPGMEVVAVDGTPVKKWLADRTAELADLIGFSTDNQAFFYTCHWGLADKRGTRLRLTVRDNAGKKKDRTVPYKNASVVPDGPAFYPDGLNRTADVRSAKLPSGFGYVHVRRCPGDLPDQVERAVSQLGDVPGLVLDFRGNSGGGFDHDDLMGRFIPKGKSISFAKGYRSTGENPFGGPIVVIIDATVRSAGETGSGMFKEDGRAYMIGESTTAGMSSQKKTIELPSELFSLYVSVASNKGRFNRGRGIEGIGVIPHETVEFDPDDLAKGVDTLIRRAEALLRDFPQKKVPYDPKRFR